MSTEDVHHKLGFGDPLSILTHAPAEEVKKYVDALLPELGEIQVLQNRTGLVMLPYTDSRKGTAFHVGEVLVAEARVRLGGAQGYAVCVGRDQEQALAVAILDAALSANLHAKRIRAFVDAQAESLAADDRELLRCVEATRIELETF